MIQFLIAANMVVLYVIGALVAIAAVCLVIYCYIYKSVNVAADRADAKTREKIASSLNEIERWCSYEYPVIEEVCKHLRAVNDDQPHSSINQFRELLRRKYPKENIGDIQTIIALAKGVLDGVGDETWKARMKVLSEDLAKRYDIKI
jgi:hypothetical protein